LGEFASAQLIDNCRSLAETAALSRSRISADDLYGAFRATSEVLREFVLHNGPFDLYEYDYPGTIGTIIATAGQELRWAHLGDTALILVSDHDGHLLTQDQVAGFRTWLHSNAEHLPTRVPDRIRYLHGSVRNNLALKHAYGVLTGEPAALEFIETGVCSVKIGDRLVLASDGLGPLWDLLKWRPIVPGHVPSQVVRCLRESTAQTLLDMAEEAETKNRSVRSDDKTVVLIDIG
jgi:serine/threonine protein phosphatase PrpC